MQNPLRLLREAAELRQLLWGPPPDAARLRDYQNRRLAVIMRAAWQRPHYAQWWREAGLQPGEILRIDDIRRLPVISKRMLQGLPPGSVTPARVKIRTSGSTGQPMEIRRTRFEDWLLRAFRIRVLRSYGLKWRGDRRASFATSTAGHPTSPTSPHTPWFMKLGLLEYYQVDITRGLEDTMLRLGRLHPTVLTGHVEELYQLSLGVDRRRLRDLHLRFLTGGVQTVTPDMRRHIEEAFQLRLFVTYGSSEFNLLASECPRTGLLHLNEAASYVEVLCDGTPAREGELGEVFATNLHVASNPFLRFSLGDWATMGPARCPCGAPVRTLVNVMGRILEMYSLPGGRTVHPFALANPLQEFTGWLGEYRLIQERLDLIRIPFRTVPGVEAPADAVDRIRAVVSPIAGPHVTLEPQLVDRLEPSPKGKNRVFQSRLRD